MNTRQPRFSIEDHARRGKAIYEHSVRPVVEPGNYGQVVALDIETEAFEVAADTLTAADHLLARCPEAQI